MCTRVYSRGGQSFKTQKNNNNLPYIQWVPQSHFYSLQVLGEGAETREKKIRKMYRSVCWFNRYSLSCISFNVLCRKYIVQKLETGSKKLVDWGLHNASMTMSDATGLDRG